MALIETSQTRNNNHASGFTLIEILVVMVLIGFIIALGAKKLQNPNNSIKQAVRQIATIARELHIRAKLSGTTFRIAMELNPKKPDRMWVEAATTKITFPSEKELRERKSTSPDERIKSPFTIDKRIGTGGVRELPAILKIKRVEYANEDQTVTEGTAYVHFLPEGIVEESAIHIATVDDSIKWTLSIHPITGKVDLINGDVSLKEIREQ